MSIMPFSVDWFVSRAFQPKIFMSEIQTVKIRLVNNALGMSTYE